MIPDKTLKRIIKDISLKQSIGYNEVEQIVESEFKFIRDKISEGTLENIHLIWFGKFVPKDHARYVMEKVMKKMVKNET